LSWLGCGATLLLLLLVQPIVAAVFLVLVFSFDEK
jgi:hypothetical protein